jgi:transposase, IS5 family
MTQMSFGGAECAAKRKKTRRELFLEEMEQVVPWKSLLNLIGPFYPSAGNGRHPHPLEKMLRVHLMQNWFGLSDLAMEEALYEITPMRVFARLSVTKPIPDETTILHFRHLLEKNELAPEILRSVNAHLTRKGLLLKRGSIVDATIIAAPGSTKNEAGARDPGMHRVKMGNQWHFGMKAHIGVDADSGLVHTVVMTAANESDVVQVDELLHSKEQVVHADGGYTGAQNRVRRKNIRWEIAAKRGRIKAMADSGERRAIEANEKRKASVRAKVEHPFRVIKGQFGLIKVRFRGLAKNTAHVVTLFALSNLWMARKRLMAMTGALRPQFAK